MRLIDKLQDRGLVDRYGFLLFAVGGSLAILLAKYFAIETWQVAIFAAIIMITYAIIINMGGTGKLRSDQAGDNCYYLGLIYTLTSLSYTIFTFDPEDNAAAIVQGFGVALATTVLGLILRVFFSQSRVDLYEIEESARLELSQAAGALRAELSQISLSFKDFSLGLQQSLKEVRDEAKVGVSDAAAKALELVQGLSEEVSKSLASQADDLSVHAAELAKKTASVSRSIERYGTSIDALADSHQEFGDNVKNIAAAAKDFAANSSSLAEQAGVVRALQSETKSLVEDVSSAASNLNANTSGMLQTFAKFENEFATRLAELESGPKQTADKALAAIAKAAQSVEAAMVRLSEAQQAAIEQVGGTTEGLLDTIRGHNAGLESELGRSRENVAKVHSALVEMTDKLNGSME